MWKCVSGYAGIHELALQRPREGIGARYHSTAAQFIRLTPTVAAYSAEEGVWVG